MENAIRINKYLSECKFCSRRQADSLINEGRVKVDGNVATMGQKVFLNQIVTVDGSAVKRDTDYVYLAYNKPRGVICTTDLSIKDNIVERVNFYERIFPIGRLDKDSTGLIFLTNDGDIVNKILRAKNGHEKEYIVDVDKEIDNEFLYKMSNGIPILGTITKKCKIKKLGDKTFKIILMQGLNRQIRRMCEYLGYEVVNLKRVRIMNVALGTLKPGEYRELTKKEMAEISNRIESSVKDAVILDGDENEFDEE